MSYTFTTELLGPKAEVEGVFSAAEPQTMTDPGCPSEFEIESIKDAEGIEYEVDCICDETLKQIEQEAFDDVAENQSH